MTQDEISVKCGSLANFVKEEMKRMKKLSDSELDIMRILWGGKGAMTSNEILEGMKPQRDWKLASLMAVLARMAEKGYVYCDRSTRTNYYSAVVSEEEYKIGESEQFLGRLFDKSATKLIASLYHGKKFSEAEIDELRTFLDSLGGENK